MPADNVRSSRLSLTVNRHQTTVTHVVGVTGQHEVLMFGQYTRDPEKVVSI